MDRWPNTAIVTLPFVIYPQEPYDSALAFGPLLQCPDEETG
jgi:hypothetical protein